VNCHIRLQRWYCRLWSGRGGLPVVCTVWKLLSKSWAASCVHCVEVVVEELGCQLGALCGRCCRRAGMGGGWCVCCVPGFDVFKKLPNGPHDWQPSSTRPQPAIPALHILCGSSLHCSPDDGHIDARNMLR
jgi:hypothetical protein